MMNRDTVPLVSCVMPTYGRPAFVNEAVGMFLDQDYPRKELVILNDCAAQHFECDYPEVRVFNEAVRYPTLGEKRNAAIALARGELIAVWDDDDVYLPWRLSLSVDQMRRHATPFYRPTWFWAYWDEPHLHENQSVADWVNHAVVTYRKDLWERVGGYPALNVGEDARFFDRVHRELGEEFIKYPLARHDRFFILRGKSRYRHMSIRGGKQPLDTAPGRYRIEPAKIEDGRLRAHRDRLVSRRDEMQRLVAGRQPLLSVCVSLKNRSRIEHGDQQLTLFPNFLRSLAAAAEQLGTAAVDLVVADYHSDDWPLEEWIAQAAGALSTRVIPAEGDFSRGAGLNLAAGHARGDWLFLCDADMLVPASLLFRGVDVLGRGRAFFPVFRYLDIDGQPQGLEHASFGNAMLPRRVFEAVGGVPPFKSWGGEDDVFHDRVRRHMGVEREYVQGFDHQWHPERCRHEHYVRPRKSDYLRFQKSSCRGAAGLEHQPLVVGLGTGRCGTKSLARLLNLSHECGGPLPWKLDPRELQRRLAGWENAAAPPRGDVGFYYLPYVEHLRRWAVSQSRQMRFVCLRRAREEVVQSYLRHTEGRNHWTRHDGTRWRVDATWDPAYPKYDEPTKAAAIGRFWDDYYREADRLAARMNDFRVFPLEGLSRAAGRRAILDFVEAEGTERHG